jgi:hypothetical protein
MHFFPEPTKIAFDADCLWVTLDDGRTMGVPLAWYPRLLHGNDEQRADFFLSPSGIHWDALDEDISIAGIFASQVEFAQPARDAA